MTDEQLLQFARKWGMFASGIPQITGFAHDIRRAALEEAIQIIETHRVPVGNSAAGEMAAGWTMDALHEIRDAIRALSQKNPQ